MSALDLYSIPIDKSSTSPIITLNNIVLLVFNAEL
jgi:hypothetical protein